MTDPIDRPLVYVAGPYTGDQATNVKAAIDCAERLIPHDVTPVVPHLTHFWDMMRHHPYGWWLQYDLALLARCDALFRMPGASSGADAEVKWAIEHGLLVFNGVWDLDYWVETGRLPY